MWEMRKKLLDRNKRLNAIEYNEFPGARLIRELVPFYIDEEWIIGFIINGGFIKNPICLHLKCTKIKTTIYSRNIISYNNITNIPVAVTNIIKDERDEISDTYYRKNCCCKKPFPIDLEFVINTYQI